METLLFLIGVAAICVLSALLAYALGWLLTEVITLPLKFKPFNCRPCLTFWLTVILVALVALIITPHIPGIDTPQTRAFIRYGLIGVGGLLGFINFLYIQLKVKIYD